METNTKVYTNYCNRPAALKQIKKGANEATKTLN